MAVCMGRVAKDPTTTYNTGTAGDEQATIYLFRDSDLNTMPLEAQVVVGFFYK